MVQETIKPERFCGIWLFNRAMFAVLITEGKPNFTKTDLKEVIQHICSWMLKNNVAIMAIKWPNNCIPEMGSSQGNNWVPSAISLIWTNKCNKIGMLSKRTKECDKLLWSNESNKANFLQQSEKKYSVDASGIHSQRLLPLQLKGSPHLRCCLSVRQVNSVTHNSYYEIFLPGFVSF